MHNVNLFIKLTEEESAIVLVFVKEKKVYIHQAFLFDNLSDCISKAKELLNDKDENYPIETVLFDASIYQQEGYSFRESTDIRTLLFSNRKKFEYRVANQVDYIKDFVFRKTQTENYARFMTLFESFSKTDKYNVAVDILCDISKYCRIHPE